MACTDWDYLRQPCPFWNHPYLVRPSLAAPSDGSTNSHHFTPCMSHGGYTISGHASFHSPWPNSIGTLDIGSRPNATNAALFGTDSCNTWNRSTTQACTCINRRPVSSLSIGSLTDNSTAAVEGIGPSLNCCNAQHHNQSQVHTDLISPSTHQSRKAPYDNEGQGFATTGYAVDHLAFGNTTTYFWPGADTSEADNDGRYCSYEEASCDLSAYPSFTSSTFDSGYFSDISKQRGFADVVMEDSHLEGCSDYDFRNLPGLHHEAHASARQQAGLLSSKVIIEEPTGEADAQCAGLGRGALCSKSKRLIHRYLFTFFP